MQVLIVEKNISYEGHSYFHCHIVLPMTSHYFEELNPPCSVQGMVPTQHCQIVVFCIFSLYEFIAVVAVAALLPLI